VDRFRLKRKSPGIRYHSGVESAREASASYNTSDAREVAADWAILTLRVGAFA
jgi:hypothetical protein